MEKKVKGYYVDEDGVIFTVFEDQCGEITSNSGYDLKIDNKGFLLVGNRNEEGLTVDQEACLWPTLTGLAKVIEE